MEVSNAKIKDVTVGLNDREWLCVSMVLESADKNCYNLSFILANPVEVERLAVLMNYVEVRNVNDLNGRIIRKISSKGELVAFGHPIEDKFVLLMNKPLSDDKVEEMSEKEICKR